MGDYFRSQQLVLFLIPKFIKVSDQQTKCGQQYHIIDNIAQSNSPFRNSQPKIKTGCCRRHHPKKAHRDRIKNFSEIPLHFRVPALFHSKNLIQQGTAQSSYGINKLLNATESPLKTLKSTLAVMPFTFPWSLCCQKDQLRSIRGCSCW